MKWLPTFIREAGWQDWVFSLRQFMAGMLALYLALWLNTGEPVWALMTVYIVGRPLSGMVLAKGVYRFVGSLVGAVVAIGLLGYFVQSPWVLLVALSLWMAICTFGASLLRNFRSYAFVLSGYSAVIICVPAMFDPAHAFNIAMARVTEISLGIFCSSLATLLINPQTVGQVYLATIKKQFYQLVEVVSRIAAGETSPQDFQATRRQLVLSSVSLEGLREHALFDSGFLRRQAASCRRLGHELLSLLSSLGPLYAYINRYARRYPDLALTVLTKRLAGLNSLPAGQKLHDELLAIYDLARQEAREQRETITKAEPERFYAGQLLLEQTAEITDRLRSATILYGMVTQTNQRQHWRASVSQLHLDYGAALRNSIRVMIAMVAAVLIWRGSGTFQGENIMIIVSVVCSLFSTRANPVNSARFFIKGVLVSCLLAFVYYLLLPQISGFLALLLLLAPLYLIAGLAMTRVASLPVAAATTIFFPILLNLGPHQVFDMAAFVNGSIGLLAGLMVSVLAFLLCWPGDTEDRARLRLCQDLCHLVARWPLGKRRRSRHELETLLYDRLAKTFPALETTGTEDARLLQGSMALVTLALSLNYLDALIRRGVPPDVASQLQRIVNGCQQSLENCHEYSWEAVNHQLDAGIALCRQAYPTVSTQGERRRLIRALVRLRMLAAILQNHHDFFQAGTTPERQYWDNSINAEKGQAHAA